ncbi:MAG: glycosyltransferase family 4 protein [Chlorobium sp.]|nr:glycosyltransferase family 4 protein [Chlorobium sp.]
MKITFILARAGLDGGIRVVATYADLLKKRGHDVTVFSTPLRPLSFKQKVKSFLKDLKWPLQKQGPSHFDGLDVQHTIIDQYRPITNDDVPDADVVIATWWETAEWVNTFTASKGKKVYFVQHHEVFPHLPIARVKATYALPFHKITISNWLLEIMRNEYGDNNVSLVPNSVDHQRFNAPPREKQSIPTVGFMYSHAHFKGCDIIIEALNKARQSIPELKIIAFGACEPSTSLPLPPSTVYYLRPKQDTIPAIYSSCDFWIFGSRAEGFGLPLLEAMACRTPVIATTAGAAPDLLSSGSGILLKENTAESMAQTIRSAFTISNLEWQSMSEKGYKVATGYTWDNATDLFEKAISQNLIAKDSEQLYRN